MLHLRFNYDREKLQMSGLLPPDKSDTIERLSRYRDHSITVFFRDHAPHLHIDGRYIAIEYDAATETFGTHHLPFTRYASIEDLAADYIEFTPRPRPKASAWSLKEFLSRMRTKFKEQEEAAKA
jgi:hypothetical protein